MGNAGAADKAKNNASRAVWLKNLHQWHWISSALCLLGMFLFAITGITLNHAGQIEAKPAITRQQATLPAPLVTQLAAYAASHDGANAPMPAAAETWLKQQWSLNAGGRPAEWSIDEVYLPLPKAGGDAWVRIGLEDGAAEYELTDRGWVSWLNDVHKGRNTGVAWSWFIDIFAGAPRHATGRLCRQARWRQRTDAGRRRSLAQAAMVAECGRPSRRMEHRRGVLAAAQGGR